MDNGLLDTAALNFENARLGKVPSAIGVIACGLMQVARAAKGDSTNPSMMETAAKNFDNAQGQTGDAQIAIIALGLVQFARALKR